MIPRLYCMDAHTLAQDLASSVLSSSSPPAIASAISAAESILCKLSADQTRAFFSIAFPAIICRLFGFDESSTNLSSSRSTAWIDQAYHNPVLASRLFALLSPQGPLFSAISSADRHGLVKYVFPTERLPEWMRYALQSERHSSILSDLCPLFRGRVKEDPTQGAFQLQLNSFEYYIFWFAYYPVCRGNSKGSDDILGPKSRRKSRLENWTASLPVLVNSSRKSGQKTEASLYLRLLYSYLCAFVPKCGLGSHQPYRSSLLHYSSSCDISVFEQAEILVYALIHFWLVDNDFSPLPLNVSRSFGISFQHRAFIVEAPPTAGLGEVVKLFVKYLSSCLVLRAEGGNQKVLGLVGASSMTPMLSLESTACSWNSAVQRPLYRFLLRTFLFCPIGASIKNVDQVLSMWVTYMVPWKTNPEDFVEFEQPKEYKLESSTKELNHGKIKGENERSHPPTMYTSFWEGYVASNYLFYSSLFVHFLGFAHKFLHTNVETVVEMVSKVLNILSSSKELIDLLRKIDTAYHSKQSGLYSLTNVDKYVPSIRQQLKDWEDGLCESGTDGSFLHENWNQHLKLFNDEEDGALKLLQLLVLRAEHEIHLTSGNTQSVQALDSIRSQMNILFEDAIAPETHLPKSIVELSCPRNHREDVFAPKHPGFRAGKWADVKYEGDWMHRPISDTEVVWLAGLLIRFSDWLNESLGFDRVESSSEPCQPTYVELASGDRSFEGGPKEFAVMILNQVASWIGLFGHSVVSFMRGHGMRINLRVFSSKKFILFLIIYVIVYALKKACNRAAAAWSLADEAKLARNHT